MTGDLWFPQLTIPRGDLPPAVKPSWGHHHPCLRGYKSSHRAQNQKRTRVLISSASQPLLLWPDGSHDLGLGVQQSSGFFLRGQAAIPALFKATDSNVWQWLQHICPRLPAETFTARWAPKICLPPPQEALMLLLQSLGPRVGLWGHPHRLLDLHTLGFWQGQHPKQLACSTHCVAPALAMVLALPCYRHACWRTPSSPHKPHCSSEGTSSLVASQPTRLSGPAFILTVPDPTENHFERPVPGPSRRLGLGEWTNSALLDGSDKLGATLLLPQEAALQ